MDRDLMRTQAPNPAIEARHEAPADDRPFPMSSGDVETPSIL